MKSKPPFAVELPFSPKRLLAVALIVALFPLGGFGRSAAEDAAPGLIISEVHPNAAAHGSAAAVHEWVEITNLAPRRVSLGGWFIEDAQAVARLPDCELEPGASALVVGSSAEMRVPPGAALIVLDSARIGSGLRNAGDRVALIAPDGVRYDAVSWGDIRNPRYLHSPAAGHSIVRTPLGYQRENERSTPWSADPAIRANPKIHRHAPPNTQIQLVSAMIDPPGGQAETITVRNLSPRPVVAINWALTAGASLVRLYSARIEPGDVYTFSDPSGRFGSGLARSGGRLVLRDPQGRWLATASWGNDETFHRQAAPEAGAELRFDPLTRARPSLVGGASNGATPTSQPTALRLQREPTAQDPGQEADDDADHPLIWISEVYPSAGRGRNDAAYEWFELTNGGEQPLELLGWTIADNISADPLDGVMLPPMASVIIGVSTQAHADLIPVIIDGRIGNGLANSGDQLRLINPAGLVVSAVSWGSDRSISAVRAPNQNQSIHLTNPGAAPRIAAPNPGALLVIAAAAQESSTAADSGGAAQSDSQSIRPTQPAGNDAPGGAALIEPPNPPASVRITEILPAPLSGGPEWVELFNPGDAAIDLVGWTIGDLVRRTELSGVIPPSGRLVIASSPLDVDTPTVVVDRIGNGLHNVADTIAIYDAADREVDRVAYGTADLPAPDSGRSIALDPARWVVTAQASPGADTVVPLLDDAFRAASIRAPLSDDGRQPVVQTSDGDDGRAWMIVSFALIGVILTLALRLWQPPQAQPEPQSAPTPSAGPTNAAPAEPVADEDGIDPDRGRE